MDNLNDIFTSLEDFMSGYADLDLKDCDVSIDMENFEVNVDFTYTFGGSHAK